VVSLLGASFLIFLFGIYAGRELEARKAVENTRIVRIGNHGEGEKISEAQPEIVGTTGTMEQKEKPTISPQSAQQIPKTVVVVSPQKPNEPPPTTSSTVLSGKDPSPKTDLVKKSSAGPVSKETAPPSPVARASQEKKIVPKTDPPSTSLAKNSQSTRGQWSIQIHATREEGAAQQIARQLRSQGYAPSVSKIVRDGEVWYRVRVGSFANAEEARTSSERLRREGKFSQAYPVSN